MIQIFIYLTPVIVVFALLWSFRGWIKSLFSDKYVKNNPTNEYDVVKQQPAVRFASSWRMFNDGKKQEEVIFRTNGKKILNSESYKLTQKEVFKTD